MKSISIRDAKAIREGIGATHIVIFAMSENGQQQVATHGGTEIEARQAAAAGNKLKVALGWPPEHCKTAPLERICKHCTYYKPSYGTWCFNGWTGDGSSGTCQLEPGGQGTIAGNKCRHFEPKY